MDRSNMTINKRIIVLAISLAIASSSALAAAPGFYGGASIGMASITNNSGSPTIYSDKVGNGFQDLALGLVAGYNIGRFIGVEASVDSLGIFGWNNVSGGNVSAFPSSLEVIGYLPVHKGIDLYGKFGTTNMRLAYSTSANQPPIEPVTAKNHTYGYGIEFSTGEMEACRIGVEHFDLSVPLGGPASSTDYVSITGLVHF